MIRSDNTCGSPLRNWPVGEAFTGGQQFVELLLTYWREKVTHAAKSGDINAVKKLLAAGVNVNYDDSPFCRTALQEAAKGGYIDVVNILLAAGADVNAAGADVYAPGIGKCGCTALQEAAKSGYINVVNVLLAAGADVNVLGVGDYSYTALQVAARNDHVAIVKALLDAGADVNALGVGNWSYTALQGAAENGHVGVVHVLLAAEADGYAVLRGAAKGGHISLANILVEALLAFLPSVIERLGQTNRTGAATRPGHTTVERLSRMDSTRRRLPDKTRRILGFANGVRVAAVPDTGAVENFVSAQFAQRNKIWVDRSLDDRQFQLIDGRKVSTVGRAQISWSFISQPPKTQSIEFI